MALKFMRGILRTLKATLLLIALAAALVWLQSYFIPGKIEFHRWTGWWGHGGGKGSTDGWVNQTSIAIGCGRGRMGVQRQFRQYSAYSWSSARQPAEREGAGWRREIQEGSQAWYTMEGGSALGPFRWAYGRCWVRDGDEIAYLSALSTRCWIVVVAAAAWPLASLTLLARRRLRARQLARIGHCPFCNYDLRATPTRCPECGATFPHPNDRRWLKHA